MGITFDGSSFRASFLCHPLGCFFTNQLEPTKPPSFPQTLERHTMWMSATKPLRSTPKVTNAVYRVQWARPCTDKRPGPQPRATLPQSMVARASQTRIDGGCMPITAFPLCPITLRSLYRFPLQTFLFRSTAQDLVLPFMVSFDMV